MPAVLHRGVTWRGLIRGRPLARRGRRSGRTLHDAAADVPAADLFGHLTPLRERRRRPVRRRLPRVGDVVFFGMSVIGSQISSAEDGGIDANFDFAKYAEDRRRGRRRALWLRRRTTEGAETRALQTSDEVRLKLRTGQG